MLQKMYNIIITTSLIYIVLLRIYSRSTFTSYFILSDWELCVYAPVDMDGTFTHHACSVIRDQFYFMQ